MFSSLLTPVSKHSLDYSTTLTNDKQKEISAFDFLWQLPYNDSNNAQLLLFLFFTSLGLYFFNNVKVGKATSQWSSTPPHGKHGGHSHCDVWFWVICRTFPCRQHEHVHCSFSTGATLYSSAAVCDTFK